MKDTKEKKVKEEELPDSEVIIKVSICPKCNGWIRAAVKHMMDVRSKNEFKKEVFDYNLSVKEIPLLEYREGNIQHCSCDKKIKK